MHTYYEKVLNNEGTLLLLLVSLTGFILTLIEIYNRHLADRIEERIDKTHTYFKEKANKTSGRSINHGCAVSVFLWIASIVISPVILYLVLHNDKNFDIFHLYKAWHYFFPDARVNWWWKYYITVLNIDLLILLPVLVVVLFWLIIGGLFYLLAMLIKLLNGITGGRALGAIGLIISSIDIFKEFYDVLKIFLK